MKEAHGGRLIERILDERSAEEIKENSNKFINIPLNQDKVQELFNIATGIFSPLEGFMNKEDYKSVIIRSRLSNDIAWTIPVVLDISQEEKKRIPSKGHIILSFEGKPIGLMEAEDVYRFDKTEYAKSVFGTDDANHPGVGKIFAMKDFLVGGKVSLLEEPPNPFYKYTLRPKETRVLFKEKGWTDVVGFQTRNVPHIGHEYVQKTALSFVDGLFINPVVGYKKKGDFKDEVILAAYQELIKHYYLKERAVMAILYAPMNYAGPKEAIHHAIIRKNFGCTHFIIGRDHAGVGNYYEPFAAHRIFDKFPDLGIIPLFFRSFFYCKKCASAANDKTCPHSFKEHINFSGTEIRKCFLQGKIPSETVMRPEVARVILSFDKPFVE